MKHYVTPEQFAPIEDAPATIDDFAIKSLNLPYHIEAGAYALVKVPDNWDGKLAVRAMFKANGVPGGEVSMFVSANFYPEGAATPTNSASVTLCADVSGSAGNVCASSIEEIDCSGCSGTVLNIKVQVDTEGTTEDMTTDLVMLELFIGTY